MTDRSNESGIQVALAFEPILFHVKQHFRWTIEHNPFHVKQHFGYAVSRETTFR